MKARFLIAAALGAGLFFSPGTAKLAAPASTPWWKNAIVYEIYPRSFQDTNGDGVGDLNGITQRLDYIKSLGVDAIWLTPVYPSPQVDFGYDISDFKNIDPKYGTLADFDRLVAAAKQRGIRVVMDFVPNHSSDRHPWFVESASSRNNPKRNWYIWRDGKNGGPPNNWQSVFGHSSWQYDAKTKQYYYHKFYIQQPDLNWRNPAVQKAMYDVVHFWIARGVDGFRIDSVTSIFKDSKLRDEDVIRDQNGKPVINAFGDVAVTDHYSNDLPEVHGVLRELRHIADRQGERHVVLIGETWTDSPTVLRAMYGARDDELQLPMDLAVTFIDKMDVARFRTRIDDAETKLGGNTPLFVLGNHDRPRLDRYNNGVFDPDISRVLSTVILGSHGTAMYYYGDEIGMVTTPPTRKADVRDPVGITGWPKEKGRDGERTPMQWTAAPNAGFTKPGVKTWLPIPGSAAQTNVAAEAGKPDSLLTWYQQLGGLKHANEAFRDGTQTMLDAQNPSVLSWLRRDGKGDAVVVACNFTAQPQKLAFDLTRYDVRATNVRVLMNSPGQAAPQSLRDVALKPFGVVVLQVH